MTGDTNKRMVKVLDENSKLYRLTTPDGTEEKRYSLRDAAEKAAEMART